MKTLKLHCINPNIGFETISKNRWLPEPKWQEELRNLFCCGYYKDCRNSFPKTGIIYDFMSEIAKIMNAEGWGTVLTINWGMIYYIKNTVTTTPTLCFRFCDGEYMVFTESEYVLETYCRTKENQA